MAPFANWYLQLCTLLLTNSSIATEKELAVKKECVATWAHLLASTNSLRVTEKVFL